jgi:hypothetical protein
MSITIQQARFVLSHPDDIDEITFDWPLGTDEVTVSSNYIYPARVCSVQEAAEIFDDLIEDCWY